MQPTNYNVPPGELPRPQYERAPAEPTQEPGSAPHELAREQAPEQGASLPPAPMAAQPATALPQIPAAPAAPSQGMAPTDNTALQTPQIADDADLIEKEWVTKAKQIVEQTKNDPYLQTKEMNKMKADYLKK